MFGLIWSRIRNHLYDKQIVKSERFPGFIISIGNLTWGGTGKTSLTLQLAQFFTNHGYRVAIVSRGYHRSSRGLKLVSDGINLKCGWEESGDEAFLLAVNVPRAIVVVAEERAEALRLLETIQPDIILLDDGFQHRRIARDVDIVLIDASEDITSQHIIPFGKLREEPGSIARADAVILTHSNQVHPKTSKWISQNVKSNIFHANYVIEDPAAIRGKRIGAFCGIGAPDHFFHLLKQNGADLVETKSFRDHYRFSEGEIERFRDDSQKASAEFVVTTAKDAIRLDHKSADSLIKVIHVKLQIDEEKIFYDFLMGRMRRQ